MSVAERKAAKARRKLTRNNTDPLSANYARQVLRDATYSANELKTAFANKDKKLIRLRWISTISLLRAVGHVLHKRDAGSCPFMRQAINSSYQEWKVHKDNTIFQCFIEEERNLVLKEYDLSSTCGDDDYFILIGIKAFRPIEAIDAAIAWWKHEISRIELSAACKKRDEHLRKL